MAALKEVRNEVATGDGEINENIANESGCDRHCVDVVRYESGKCVCNFDC